MIRPGGQIDRNLDVTQIPNFTIAVRHADGTTASWAVLFKESDFWAQGMMLGIEFRY